MYLVILLYWNCIKVSSSTILVIIFNYSLSYALWKADANSTEIRRSSYTVYKANGDRQTLYKE